MNNEVLTKIITISLILLFISGCWTLGSLMIVQLRLENKLLSSILSISNAIANASFLISILASILGLVKIMEKETIGKIAAYILAIGIFFLIFSIVLFLWIITTMLPPYAYD